MKNCNINYITNTIELTKKFAKAAGVLNSPEYNELLAIRRDYPTLPIVIREIKRKAGKKTYKNLTIAKMREYIATQADADAGRARAGFLARASDAYGDFFLRRGAAGGFLGRAAARDWAI